MKSTWVVGVQAIRVLLESYPEKILSLHISGNTKNDSLKALVNLAKSHGLSVTPLSSKEIDAVACGANHQQIAAQCKAVSLFDEKKLAQDCEQIMDSEQNKPLYLLLDGVQDPHNLGACLRSADAAGVQGVIFPKDKACGITPVVQKVACGALMSLKLYQVKNLVRAIEILKKNHIWIYGTSDQATQSLFETDLEGACAIVMGQEGEGMRDLTMRSCDYLLSLPMHGVVDSLNVSVATGIFLFEVLRQRQRLS